VACVFYDAGTPFQFLVTDLNKASARGDGLGVVKVGQVATFYLSAPAAQLKDITVNITGTCIYKQHELKLTESASFCVASLLILVN